MVLEAIGDVGLAGLAEADEVRRDATRDRRDMRDDLRQMKDEVGLPCRKSATGASLEPPPGRPSRNRGRKASAGVMSIHGRGLLEHGGENDAFEALERLGVALDFHAQDGALPGGEQEFGEVLRRECVGDLACRLAFRDACGERGAPFGEDLGEPRPQRLALRRGLEAEIADQAAAGELALASRSVMMSR